jgi:uncharacterized protein (TIGR02391 family)
MSRQAEIQRVIRVAPMGNERAYRDLTKDWSLDEVDYAIERTHQDTPLIYLDQVTNFLRRLREEKGREELALRLNQQQIDAMKNRKEVVAPTTPRPDRPALLRLKERGEAILRPGADPGVAFEVWTNAVREEIGKGFGETSEHINTFVGDTVVGISSMVPISDVRRVAIQQQLLKRRIEIVDQLIAMLPDHLPVEEHPQSGDYPWADLYPHITGIVRGKFEAGYYRAAVHAAFTELNNTIRDYHLQKTGKEEDGVSLMNQALGTKSPSVVLADISTDTGRNIQEGHRFLLAGAMAGIRNPAAHTTEETPRETALEQLFVCSYLFRVVEPALK